MKLTEVIAVWELLHVKDVGEIGYCDLEAAVEKICGVVNNVPGSPPSIPYDVLAARVKDLEAQVYSLTLWKRVPAAQMQSDPMRAAQLLAKSNLDVIETNDRLSERVKELEAEVYSLNLRKLSRVMPEPKIKTGDWVAYKSGIGSSKGPYLVTSVSGETVHYHHPYHGACAQGEEHLRLTSISEMFRPGSIVKWIKGDSEVQGALKKVDPQGLFIECGSMMVIRSPSECILVRPAPGEEAE